MKRMILSLGEDEERLLESLTREMRIPKARILREAIRGLYQFKQKEKEEEERKKKRIEASLAIDALAYAAPRDKNWDPVKIIREWRDKDRLQRMQEGLTAGEPKASYRKEKGGRKVKHGNR